MRRNAEINRQLTIAAMSAPAAALVWFVFHRVYTNLSQTEAAAGYVDPTTQMGIDLGYAAMVGGTLAFAGLALWAVMRAVLLWYRERRR